ncbi:MAG: hypothetical protein JWO05_1536 [Gemmatimonadetes bacterium]|nr:hypothetical protein [Gemmatimonadota bacterium]
MAVGLLALEAGLRPFETPQSEPVPRIAADSFSLPVVSARQLEEGLGVANYSSAGARLTGHDVQRDAPVVVLLGDSYVAAREVRDDETMGARAEESLRAAGMAVNVRQYGTRGATPALYVANARDLLHRWEPAAVVVVLSYDDIDHHPLTEGTPRIAIDAGKGTLVGSIPPAPAVASSGLLAHSTLLRLFARRRLQLLARSPRFIRNWWIRSGHPANPGDPLVTRVTPATPAELEAIPRVVVQMLHAAYGERLVIAWVSEVRLSGPPVSESYERALFSACAAEGVTCLSARDEMLAARDSGIILRGFPTSTLGEGHLNAAGHRVMGALIAREIESRRRSAIRY